MKAASTSSSRAIRVTNNANPQCGSILTKECPLSKGSVARRPRTNLACALLLPFSVRASLSTTHHQYWWDVNGNDKPWACDREEVVRIAQWLCVVKGIGQGTTSENDAV